MHPAVCTLEDAATLLSLHPTTISAHVRSGLLPGMNRGRLYRLWRPALLAYAHGTDYTFTAADDPWSDREVFSTAECADALGISDQTVLSLIASRSIDATRIGRVWRISWPRLREQLYTSTAR